MAKTYSAEEFEECVLAAAEQIDFAAKCITPWHLIGVKAFVEKRIAEKGSVTGYVYIKYHGVSGYVIQPEDLLFPKEAKVTVLWGRKVQKRSLKLKLALVWQAMQHRAYTVDACKRPIYILNAFYPDYLFCAKLMMRIKQPCVPVCIDEGVGTYKTRRQLFGEKWRRNKKNALIGEVQKSVEQRIGHRMPENTLHFTIFSMDAKGTLSEQKDVTCYYKKALSKNAQPMSISDKPYVLLLTQPFELSEEIAVRNLVNQTFDAVMARYVQQGCEVYVKPHPREKETAIKEYEAKGYQIIKKSMPIEQMLSSLSHKPECVVGALSTALVTASVLCDVPAKSIVHLMSHEAPAAYQQQAAAFEMRYGRVVGFIEA